jgi:hypothetical protein
MLNLQFFRITFSIFIWINAIWLVTYFLPSFSLFLFTPFVPFFFLKKKGELYTLCLMEQIDCLVAPSCYVVLFQFYWKVTVDSRVFFLFYNVITYLSYKYNKVTFIFIPITNYKATYYSLLIISENAILNGIRHTISLKKVCMFIIVGYCIMITIQLFTLFHPNKKKC